MVGSLAAALGPAALRFLRPIRVVGCGGGSYFGLSCSDRCYQYAVRMCIVHSNVDMAYLLALVIASISTRSTASDIGLLITLT